MTKYRFDSASLCVGFNGIAYFDALVIDLDIGVDFLLIKQIPRGRKFFCEVWLNLVSIETILSVKSCGFSDIDNLEKTNTINVLLFIIRQSNKNVTSTKRNIHSFPNEKRSTSHVIEQT